MVEQVSFSPAVAVSAPSTPSSTEARTEAIQQEASFEEGVQSPAFTDVIELFPKRDRILCSGRFHFAVQDTIEQLSQECLHCGAATLKGINDPVEVYWLQTQYSVVDLDSTLAIRSGPVPR